MQKKWLSILLFAPLMQSNYALADQAVKKELDYKALGEVLFFDKSISFNKTQSCSTCHSPDTAFVDQRKNSANQKGIILIFMVIVMPIRRFMLCSLRIFILIKKLKIM